jgi:hypothetical protein
MTLLGNIYSSKSGSSTFLDMNVRSRTYLGFTPVCNAKDQKPFSAIFTIIWAYLVMGFHLILLATDENTRNLACYHVQTTYNCEYVFFKTLKQRSYIDSAICDNCDSTKIVYDIELNDELWEKASKLLNIPSSSIKKDIESILKSRKNKLN